MDRLPCEAFRKNPDGSWTTTKQVTIEGPSGKVVLAPGQTFREGAQFMGLDLASLLNEQCA